MTTLAIAPHHNDPAAGLDFVLPAHLEAVAPPEARGLRRDSVRLMTSYRSDNRVVHGHFTDLPQLLDAGDLLVINTSGTMNAALPAVGPGGAPLELHLSTQLPGRMWTVEVRDADNTGPAALAAGTALQMPAGGTAIVHTPYDCGCGRPSRSDPVRLWVATLDVPLPLMEYLRAHGHPIRYSYVRDEWPSSYYQTVYATEMGSAEMPSAGRPFTPELLTRLVAKGIQIAPLLLHTGVASLESHEPPYEEYYRVPRHTAALVNAARATGSRVIAVGTTVVRALETVTDAGGTPHPGEGWTCTVVTPETGVRSVNGLLTGLHEPRSSHLLMLQAIAGRSHIERTYEEALQMQYLWHEFGDLHLLLP